MKLRDTVTKTVSSWIALAEEGEITFEQASLMINAYELGLAELAIATKNTFLHKSIYKIIADANQYIKAQGEDIVHPPFCKDTKAVEAIGLSINATINLSSRRIQSHIASKQP